MSRAVLSSIVRSSKDDRAQGMVEYLLIVSLVVLAITGLFAGLMHAFGK